MIQLKELTKSFGNQLLFEDVNLAIYENEKVGLYGRNGHGKSTLLKMMMGTAHPERGEILIRKDKTLGMLDQHIHFTQNTVREEALLGLPDLERDQIWRAAKMLWGLGFDESAQNLHPNQFSGGFQVRINLAKVLLNHPDILLLDEPTNFLDITSLRWLEHFLNKWKGTFVLVTHDQTFMDSVITHGLAVHRQTLRKLKGTTKHLRSHLQYEERIHEATRKNQEKKEVKEKKFIAEFRSGARSAGLVQSRIKMLAKIKRLKKLSPIPPINFTFHNAEFEADKLITAHNVSYAYDGQDKLFKDLSFVIYPGDRLAIIGSNGKGKSTLAGIIAGEKNPTTGTCKRHIDAEIGYFSQMNKAKHEAEKTVFEVLREQADTDTPDQKIHQLCGSLMFEGDKRHKTVKVLSGGEKSRVALGQLMLRPYNVLLLDEPTNHLDMESCVALGDALNDYDGAVIMITHDEALMRRFASSFLVFDGGGAYFYRGTYDEFLKEKGWKAESVNYDARNLEKASARNSNDDEEENEFYEGIQVDFKKQKEINRQIRPLKRSAEKLEKKIIKNEEIVTEKLTEYKSAKSKGDRLKESDLLILISATRQKIERDFEELYELMEEILEIETGQE